jgi:hypothetical protein
MNNERKEKNQSFREDIKNFLDKTKTANETYYVRIYNLPRDADQCYIVKKFKGDCFKLFLFWDYELEFMISVEEGDNERYLKEKNQYEDYIKIKNKLPSFLQKVFEEEFNTAVILFN